MTQKTAEMTANAQTVSVDEAKQMAAQYLYADPNTLTHTNDTEGNLPVYNFNTDTTHFCYKTRRIFVLLYECKTN